MSKSNKIKLGLVAFITIVIFIAMGGFKSSSPSTTFSGSVMKISVINPASVNVEFSISNTGSSAGTPNCTVSVQDPSNAYSGSDSPSVSSPIAVGGTLNGNMNLIVTGQGAQYVTGGTVTCS